MSFCRSPYALDSVTEISGEIKGERLRFVEAMKEATAINIQRELSVLPSIAVLLITLCSTC